MNKVILIGNLARDVELTNTGKGTAVAKFALAVNRNYTNADGERDCDFFNIIVWRNLAERCAQYLSKGKKAGIVGTLQTRSYEKDGVKVYVTEVVADEVEFLSPKNADNDDEPPQKQNKKRAAELQPVDDDDLPF